RLLIRLRTPPIATLSPYTTRFRSHRNGGMMCRNPCFRRLSRKQCFVNSYTQPIHFCLKLFIFFLMLQVQVQISLKHQKKYEQLQDRKSTRLNSSHVSNSYAVTSLK